MQRFPAIFLSGAQVSPLDLCGDGKFAKHLESMTVTRRLFRLLLSLASPLPGRETALILLITCSPPTKTELLLLLLQKHHPPHHLSSSPMKMHAKFPPGRLLSQNMTRFVSQHRIVLLSLFRGYQDRFCSAWSWLVHRSGSANTPERL